MEKLIETHTDNAGESEAHAEGGEVGGTLASFEIVVGNLQPGGRRAKRGGGGRKLKDVTLTERVIKENESVVLGKRKKRPGSNFENEFLDESGEGKESKSFPVPERYGLERIPRRERRVKRIVVPSGLSLSRIIRQFFFAFRPVRDRDVHGKTGAREGERDPLGNRHVGRDSRFLVPSEKALRDEADQSFEIY